LGEVRVERRGREREWVERGYSIGKGWGEGEREREKRGIYLFSYTQLTNTSRILS
jgi:hypothetical protein